MVDSAFGGAGVGVVWGWWIALKAVLPGPLPPPWRRAVQWGGLVVGSAALAVTVFWLAGTHGLLAWAGGAAGGLCLHAAGLAGLARRYGHREPNGGGA